METSQQQTTSTQISEIPPNVAGEVVTWLTQEIQLAQRERQDLTDNLVKWERMYEAVPAQQTKTFPWPGASNLEIPTIATAVETVHSRILNTIFGPKDVWSAVAKSPEWTDVVEDVARWLNWVGKEVLHLKPIVSKWVLSTIKFGTGVLKETWVHTQKKVTKKGIAGGIESSIIDTHYGPQLSTIPLADFYISNDALFSGDIQNCEWVGERQIYSYKQLKALETNEIIHDVDKIKDMKRTSATDMEEEVAGNSGYDINEFKDYELWEVYCSYDIDGDGIPEELCVLFHLETMTPLKVILNPLYHQERPYNVIRYMPRDNSFYGIGLCQMLEPIQLEVSSMHNRRLDNATLSNTAAFTRVRGSRTGPLEWYPGVVFDVNNPQDITPLVVGQQHTTLLIEEQHTNAIGEKRSGVSDYSVGRESSAIGSRATATSTLALIKEGNNRYKTIQDEVRDGLLNVGHQTIMFYQQNPDAKIYYEMFSKKNAPMIRKFLTLPQELSRAGVLIDVPAISEAYNKDVQRQTYMTLMQVMQQFYTGVMQAFQLATSPDPNIPKPMKDLAVQGATAASKIWGRVLEAFDIVDAETFTPDVETLLGIQALGEGLNGSMGNLIGSPGQQTMATPPGQNPEGAAISAIQGLGSVGGGGNSGAGGY